VHQQGTARAHPQGKQIPDQEGYGPYPVFGTIVGVPLSAWAGIREVQKLLPPKT
jgi:hypothetical protein